ncbi:MAG: nucleotidyltransferase domain-containing protein [Desulfuromonadales bacterium]|nr:MAG: nucleotidyltransferase domain-containing protein [Desulfuromonadales bacterium]
MTTVDTSLLDEITKRLVAELRPEKVILFGSHAWGTPTPESDLDLFVIVSESELRPARRAYFAYRCLEGLTPRMATDILVRTREEVDRYKDVYASLECQVLEKGKVLYERRAQ